MEVKPFSQEWIEGFISEAADLGLTQEQAQGLLKASSVAALSKDPDFVAGFNTEFQKRGAPGAPPPSVMRGLMELLSGLKSHLYSTPARATVSTAAGIGGGYLGYKALRPYINMGPDQRRLYNMLEGSSPEDYENIAQGWTYDKENRRLSEADSIKRRARSLSGGGGGGGYGGWGPVYTISPFA